MSMNRMNVFLTSSLPEEEEFQKMLEKDEGNATIIHKYAPLIYGVEWRQLGFGDYYAQGMQIQGNWDSSALFSYKSTALICLLNKPSHWQRRRVAFLIQEKGYEGNMFQRIGNYYPIFRNVCYYL